MKAMAVKKREVEESGDDSEFDNFDNAADEEVKELQESAAHKKIRLTHSLITKLNPSTIPHNNDTIDADIDIDAAVLDKEIIDSRYRKISHTPNTSITYKLHEIKSIRTKLNTNACCYFNNAVHFATASTIYYISSDSECKRVFSRTLTGTIVSMASSSDGIYMATGDKKGTISIWTKDGLKGKLIHHRDVVSGLCFRVGGYDLYSASFDRSVKVWDVGQLSYVETLFGHQDKISSIDCIDREQCITTGSRDRTLRLWKILDETQLVFRSGGGHINHDDLVVLEELKSETEKKRDSNFCGGSVDACCIVNGCFVTGSDSGAISLWNPERKKPVFTKLSCHGPSSKSHAPRDLIGVGEVLTVTDKEKFSATYSVGMPWITCLSSMPFTDIFASASGDGFINLWKVSSSLKSFVHYLAIPCLGIVNQMTFYRRDVGGVETCFLCAAAGREGRFGRWFSMKGVRDHVDVINLGPFKTL